MKILNQFVTLLVHVYTMGVFGCNTPWVYYLTPIPKEGDKCSLSSYRQISVLRVISKVFEKREYKQLYDYMENNSILHKQQYDFREKKSTTQAILHFLQYL